MNPNHIIGLLAVLSCIGLAVYYFRRPKNRVRLANIGEGTHGSGRKTYLCDAVITGRYQVVKRGSDDSHIAVVAAATDVPLGICTDETATAGMPLNVAILGTATGTLKVLLGGTVSLSDELSSANGTAIKLPTATGTYYPIGRALMAGVSGDIIEFGADTPVARVIP
jgi:hypothetical protein